MTWSRLCDRFLTKITDEDDVLALQRIAVPRFIVVIKEKEIMRAISPTSEQSSILSPVSTSTSRWSPERLHHGEKAFSDAMSLEATSDRASIVSSSQQKLRLAGDVEARRRQLRQNKLAHRSQTSPDRDTIDSEKYAKQMALLERVTTRWADRTVNTVPLLKQDESQRHEALDAIIDNESIVLQHSKEIEETKQHYVEALRCARRDVEKLRGAQQAALLLANKDESRLRRAWKSWAQEGFEIRRKEIAHAKGISRLGRISQRHVSKCQKNVFFRLDAAVAQKRAFRRGAAVALLARKFEHILRRVLHQWRLEALSKAKIQSSAQRVLNRLLKHQLLAGFHSWKSCVHEYDVIELVIARLARRLHKFHIWSALVLWREAVHGMRHEEKRLDTHHTALDTVHRLLVSRNCIALTKAFRAWLHKAHAITKVSHLISQFGIASTRKRAHRLCLHIFRAWHSVVVSFVDRKKRKLAAAQRVLNRASRSKALGAWNTWRESQRRSRRLESSLRKLGAAGNRRKHLEQRRAIDAWKQQIDVKLRLRRVLNYMINSHQRYIAQALRHWRIETTRQSHRLRLALSSMTAQFYHTNKFQVTQSFLRAWRQWRSVLDNAHLVQRHIVLRLRRSVLFKALQTWVVGINQIKTMENTQLMLRRVILRISRSRLFKAWNAWMKHGVVSRRSQQAAKHALLRMLRSAIFHAWNQWKYIVFAHRNHVHRTGFTNRIVSRWLRRAIATSWNKWITTIRHYKTAVAPAVRRCFLQAVRLQLARGFRCWVLEVQRTVDAKKMLVKTVARLQSTALLAAWLSWLGVVADAHAKDALLSRVIKRIWHLKLAQAFDAWRAANHTVYYVGLISKTLRKLSRVGLRKGWTTWLAVLRNIKAHHHARALASSARAIACLASYAGNTKKSSLRLAWAAWLSFINRDRDRSKALCRFIKFMLGPKQLRASFRRWINVMRWYAHNTRIMSRALRSMLRRDTKRTMCQWHYFTRQKSNEIALLRRVISRMVLNRTVGKMSAAWRSWHLRLRTLRHTALIAQKALRRATCIKQASAFAKWHQVLIIAHRKLQRAVVRMHAHKLAIAFFQLSSAVNHHAESERRSRLTRRVLARSQQRNISLAWRSWRVMVINIQSFDKLTKRVLRTWLHRETRSAFFKLKDVVTLASRVQARLAKTARRFMHLRLASGFDAWCTAILYKQVLESLITSTVIRWTSLKKARAMRAWQAILRGHRRANLAYRAVAKLIRKDLARAWRRWLQGNHLVKISDTITLLHSTKLEAALRRVVSAYKGSARSVLALSFRAWCQSTWHYTSNDSHRKFMIKKAVTAMLKRKAHMAFFSWSLFVKSQRILLRIVKQLSQRKLSLVWRTWLSFVQLRKNCLIYAVRLLRRWQKLQLAQGLSTWCSILHQYKLNEYRNLRLKRAVAAMTRKVVARAWRSWFAKTVHCKLGAAHTKIEETHLNHFRARLGLLINGNSKMNGKLRVQASFLHWHSIAHAIQLHRSHTLQRAVVALKPGKRSMAKAFRTLVAAVHGQRADQLQRQLTESQLSAAQKVLATTAAYNFFSACHVTSKAVQLRGLGRGFRLWLLFARDNTYDVRRARADMLRAVPTLVRSALRFAARRAFSTWEQSTIAASCRELAAQTVFDLVKAIDELKPMSLAFAIWRAESVRLARATNYDLALALAARPTELRHAALAGALGIALNATLHRFQHTKVITAFRHWRTMQSHRKAATLLSITLGAAKNALLSLAFDHWSGINERRRLLEIRLAENLCKRQLIRAWIHWWTQVEVMRELSSLQKGVRALVRVRGSHV